MSGDLALPASYSLPGRIDKPASDISPSGYSSRQPPCRTNTQPAAAAGKGYSTGNLPALPFPHQALTGADAPATSPALSK